MPLPVVCLIDEDSALRRRIADSLGPLGTRIQEFASGAACLAALPEDPLCVISDLRLPDMSGLDVIKALRSRGIVTPVILLADDGEVATAVAAMRAGAIDFLEKPHVERLLVWHVRRLVAARSEDRHIAADRTRPA